MAKDKVLLKICEDYKQTGNLERFRRDLEIRFKEITMLWDG